MIERSIYIYIVVYVDGVERLLLSSEIKAPPDTLF